MIKQPPARGLWVLATALVCAFALLMGSAESADEQPADRAAAIAAATAQAAQWLGELDAQRYAESWEQMAPVLQQRFNEEEWVREVGRPREALGRSLIREQKQAEFSSQVRGAPSGQYVTVVYLTEFANVPLTVEKVVLQLDDSGRWRVAGYDINRAPAVPSGNDLPAKKAAPPSKE
ncbi:MAG TPA: DUF4019 domain-containing protein [Casimicrobiaceae bacterium]|nr:DUF4019 domain-containing protein [Casimicrobiaceae bacterium]